MRAVPFFLLAAAACALAACASSEHHHSGRALASARGAGPLGAAAQSRIVFVGESHDAPEHHAYQLDVFKAMAAAAAADGAPLLLGMEMFQRPYQQHLDDYVKGSVTEVEMLRRTEWFERWNMDWTLYASLWRAAKEAGARVVALNAPKEVARKIGRHGLASLTEGERAQVADEIDLDVASHRARIMAVFSGGAHPMPADRLATLYESQTTWDETMAESLATALQEAGPAARAMVIAGSFHVQQRDGIPDRVQRRLGGEPPLVIVLRTAGEDFDGDPPDDVLGDHVVRVAKLPRRERAKLGIGGDGDGDGIVVEQVAPGGRAALAGVQPGDVIDALAVGDGPLGAVGDLTDLRYALDPAGPAVALRIRVRRGGGTHELHLPPAAPTTP